MLQLLRWICFLSLPLTGLAQAPADFKLEKILGTPLDFPQDVAVDAQQFIYLLDQGGALNKLDAQGNCIRQFSVLNPAPAKPSGSGYAMSLDATGNMYIADYSYSEVRKFNPEGQLVLTFGKFGTQLGQFQSPENLTVDAAGSIYVVEGTRLQKFDAQGRPQWAYQAPGVANKVQFCDVAVDPAGAIFVLQSDLSVNQLNPAGQLVQQIPVRIVGSPGLPDLTGAGSTLALDAAGHFYIGLPGLPIRKFDPAGQFLGSIGDDVANGFSGSRTALTFDAAGNLYATDRDHTKRSRLYKFNPTGQRVGKWGNLRELDCLTSAGSGNFGIVDLALRQVVKYTPGGRELLRFGGRGSGPDVFWDNVVALAFDAQENIYALEDSAYNALLLKFDAQGRLLARIPTPISRYAYARQASLAIDRTGNIYVSDYNNCTVYKLDPRGQLLGQFGTCGKKPGQLDLPRAVALDGRGLVYVADRNGHRLQVFTSEGQLLRVNDVTTSLDDSNPICDVGLSVDAAGTVFLSSTLDEFVQVYGPGGRDARRLPGSFDRLAVNHQGTRLLTMRRYTDLIHVYTTTIATTREAQITGRLFQDLNRDCVAQPTEPGLPNTVVVAEPGNYYGLSDENGNYSIAADTGRYTVRQLLPNEPGRTITPTCASQPAVHLAAYDTTVPGPDFGNQVSLAPYLRVEVGSNRRRRCFRNLTSVRYANTGFAAARAAQVAVRLPEQVVLISASAPYTRDARGNYLFAVGDLAPQQSGQITITDSVVCGNPAIRGLTVCTQAWITPGNSYPPAPVGSGGAVAVRGKTTTAGQVRFALVNQGPKATGDSLGLRVFTDAKLALNKKYALAAGDSLILRVPAAAGQALRLEADQPAGQQLGLLASATVEAAGPRPDGLPNPAMLMLPPAPTPPTVAEDCQPIIDSFDPNDKQVVPTGTGPEHDTPTGTALRYQLRFQNTGTDVAYRVEVVDTLSADLDLRTLRVGAASHPYRLTVSGKIRPVLTFTFDGIMLPEKSRNEAASNGFVQFSIRPKADLVPKTSIENYADIYFDFNEPVRTNTTRNRLYDAPPVVNLTVALRLNEVVVSPQLTSFAPAQGPAGTVVTLVGQHFSAATGSNQVSFNGVAAVVLSAAAGQLVVRVPAGATSGKIRVVTAEGGTQSSGTFQVGQATAITAPALAPALALYPNPAPGGAATLTWPGVDFTVRQVRVFDARGAQLLAVRPGAATNSLPLPLVGKPAGLYLVLVETSRGLVRKRLTVQ